MSELKKYVLKNTNGMVVELLNLGARVHSIQLPINGKMTDMVLAYQDIQTYPQDTLYLGTTCGRVCNRIANGSFELNGQRYSLPVNNGSNCLHGGPVNFSHKYWQVSDSSSQGCVVFSLVSEHLEQGFPGQLEAKVTYQLTEQNELKISFSGQTDADTPINLTNHCYFNLGEESCKELELELQAARYLTLNENSVPTGAFTPVLKGDFCFREAKRLGPCLDEPKDEALRIAEGYDHCFVLDHSPFSTPKAVLTSRRNKVQLQVFTDQPGIQLYTGRYLDGEFTPFQGVCLESQNFPDAINQAHFPNSVLRVGETYQHELIYQFVAI